MITELFSKASKASRVARALVEDGDFDDAVSRAYYAMFNAARCVLISMDEKHAKSSSHKETLSNFHRLLVHTGKVDKSFGEALQRAQNARHTADYALSPLSQSVALGHVERAERFLEMARSLLPPSELPPPLGQSHRDLQIEAAVEEAGKRSAVKMLAAAGRGLALGMDNQTAEELVIYGTEDLLAKMMQAMMTTPKAHSDLRAFAKEAGIDLPGHGL
jgi:uncharacterized protein (UPF0332 family)